MQLSPYLLSEKEKGQLIPTGSLEYVQQDTPKSRDVELAHDSPSVVYVALPAKRLFSEIEAETSGLPAKKLKPGRAVAPHPTCEHGGEAEEALPAIPRKIREIVLARALPRTETEARAAATVRKESLLRRELERGVKISSRRRAAMAFPPEFAGSFRAEAIRCICGRNEEDLQVEWVACDQCQVWQHVKCMGEGAVGNLEEDDYFCQQCDPYRHRKLIRKLRNDHPIVENLVPEGR